MLYTPVPLNLPPYPFKLSRRGEQVFIFDELRKKQLMLTPEEWVRQHFIQFLIIVKKFPKTLIQIESGLALNGLQKRSDIVILNRKGEKTMVVECKAPSIKITQATFDQAARYNSVLKTKWLVVTNGLQHHFATINHACKAFAFVDELPAFDDL